MAFTGTPNYAGIARSYLTPDQEDYEQFDVDDPGRWERGVTKFTPENIAEQWKHTQNTWRDILRDSPDIQDLPQFLVDPNTQWNDPRVRDWFGVNPETLVYEGAKNQPWINDKQSFGEIAGKIGGFMLGGGALLGGFGGLAGAGAAGGAAGGAPVSQIPLFGQAPLAGVPVSANAAWMAPGAAAGGLGGAATSPATMTQFPNGGPLSEAGIWPDSAPRAIGVHANPPPLPSNFAVGSQAAGAAPVTDLGRQAGFSDTLRNAGLGQALKTGVTGSLGTALGLGSDFAPRQEDQFGLKDLAQLGLLAGQTYIGYNEAQDRAAAAQQKSDLARDIFNYEKGNRQPSIDYYNNLLQNPDQYYQSPQATGALDAVLRGLSAEVGNPVNNPSALSRAAAYNLGGYTNALNSAAGNAGIGNSYTVGGLGNIYGNSLNSAATMGAGPGAALSYGLGGLGSLLAGRQNPYLTY